MDGSTTTSTGTGAPSIFHHTSSPSGMGMLPYMGMMGTGGVGAGVGAGLGAGLLGGILGGALLGGGNGGLFGNRNNNGLGGDFVTQAGLQTALNGQTANQNTTSILQNLATIQQLIPENEGRVQLALAGVQASLANQGAQGQLQTAASTSLLTNNIADARHNINDNIHTNGLNNANYFAGVQLGIANSTAATNAIVREAKDVAEAGFAATQLSMAGLSLQAANNTASIISAVRDTGDKVMAQAAAINDATLNRIITNQANKIIELQGDKNHMASGLNISQTVNQAQAQTQNQQQQQQQFAILGQIAAGLNGLTQVAHATNQNVIAGNTGAVQTGAQSANPVNVA